MPLIFGAESILEVLNLQIGRRRPEVIVAIIRPSLANAILRRGATRAYKIISTLGRGGMGEVYKARDSRLNRFVALKVLPDTAALDPERRDRFEREARAIAALNHPHIVTIHSVETVEGVPLLTMELVEGRALSEVIPKGGLAARRGPDDCDCRGRCRRCRTPERHHAPRPETRQRHDRRA